MKKVTQIIVFLLLFSFKLKANEDNFYNICKMWLNTERSFDFSNYTSDEFCALLSIYFTEFYGNYVDSPYVDKYGKITKKVEFSCMSRDGFSLKEKNKIINSLRKFCDIYQFNMIIDHGFIFFVDRNILLSDKYVKIDNFAYIKKH